MRLFSRITLVPIGLLEPSRGNGQWDRNVNAGDNVSPSRAVAIQLNCDKLVLGFPTTVNSQGPSQGPRGMEMMSNGVRKRSRASGSAFFLRILVLLIVFFPCCQMKALYDIERWREAFQNVDRLKAENIGREVWESWKVPGFTYKHTERFSCGGQAYWIVVVTHDKTGMEFCLIPGGSFMMGSPKGELGRDDDMEEPQHRVTVPPFLFCRTEVTEEAWARLYGADPSWWHGTYLPVTQVSWYDCQVWCRRAGLRLPSEAEWEYACRAGTTTRFYFGDSDGDLGTYAWFGESGKEIHRVAQKRPNAFGLYDMHGNVCEWCQDWCHDSYHGAPMDGSAREDRAAPDQRIGRGPGLCPPEPYQCRSARRSKWVPEERLPRFGVRPAKSLR